MDYSRLSSGEAVAVAPEVWPVYDAVFGDCPDEQTWRATLGQRLSHAM